MRIIFIVCIAVAIVLAGGCGQDSANAIKGDVHYGGKIRMNEVQMFKSLIPMSVDENSVYHITAQIYEGLTRFDKDLNAVPCIARGWDVSADLKEYTFHIRQGVRFHDDECFPDSAARTVTAQDIKFCFEALCSKNKNNRQYEVTFKDRVVGANAYYDSSGTGKVRVFRGVEVLDDSTVKVKLVQPEANFLNILAMPGCYIYPKEAAIKYGDYMRYKAVGTGPFKVQSLTEGVELLMVKNKNYWGTDKWGNQLPYLDSLKWTFVSDKSDEVRMFNEGKLDMIYRVPVDMLRSVFGEGEQKDKKVSFEIFSSAALSTHFYGFNLQTNPFFSIPEIRRAFNLAIDRKKIAENVLKGEGTAADHGIVPYTELFEKKGYQYQYVKGFIYDPDSARKLLAQVGYSKGVGLPPIILEINGGGGERNLLVAMSVVKMLKENLGVTVNLSVVNWSEHIENVQTGKTDFFRYAWVSDYADPESFLTLFYGKHVPENYQERSYVNLVRFKNQRFDSLFETARLETNQKKRFALFSRAEQIIIDEAAFIPLFYDENFRVVKKYAKNFEENPLNYIDLREVYILSPGKSGVK